MEQYHWSKRVRTSRHHVMTLPLLLLFCLPSPICASIEFNGRESASRSRETLEAAARQNEELRNRLRWSFGGRLQKGWALYLPLIQQLIGSNAQPASPAFAEAIARWQEETGLPATGQLEEKTWAAMVSTFQARRPGGRRRGAKIDLVLAPPKDFFDPSRPLSLRYVDREAYDAYQRMYEAAREALGEETLATHGLKIVSAYRSPSYQAALRRRSPRAGRATLAVNSPHFTGCALDLFVGGDPVSTADWNRHRQVETPLYHWMVRNASQFGFVPYFYEPWHWEYLGDHSPSILTTQAAAEGP
jgi:D-alanyl-D-alanine carboxypeptidase